MQAPGGDDGRRYRIVRRLGHGGMAEVFEAVLSGPHGFSRRVAIKRISTKAADDPELAERFLDEARIASQLHHAGIVGILDYGFVDGLPFQVLEFVDGLDADRLIDRAGGRLPADIALIIAADVAHALDHAHRARDADGLLLGIVHRDVKPANVLVSWDGDVKLSDFGIALARGRIAVTEAGMARGTPYFMAPEQRTRSEAGPRTDVFALGCTLHALMTGTSPLVDLAVAMRVIAGDPAPLDPGLPDDVRAVIARACAPDPDARFADCGAFADALGRLAAGRLRRDARGRLRDYLAELRRPEAHAGGLLDQLLAVDLVLAGDSRADGAPRSFTLIRTEALPHPSSADPLAPPPPPAPPPPVLAGGPPSALAPALEPEPEPELALAPPRRRAAAWIAAVLIILAGAAIGLGVAVRQRRGTTTPPPDAASVVLATFDAAAPPTADAATPAPPAPVDASPAPSPAPDARGRRADRPDARTAAPPSERPDAAPPTSTGWIRVSGAELARAQVIVDGKYKVFAPDPLEVPVGRHKLVVVKNDGTRLGPITIEVTERHTFNASLRPKL